MDTLVLLLLDEFSVHWTDTVHACAKDFNIGLMRILPGFSRVDQPADGAWNRPFKQRIS